MIDRTPLEMTKELLEGTTPGPWSYHPHGGSAFYIHAAHMLAPRIAMVCYTDGAHSFHEANARLIAAAPRLARENIALTKQLAVVTKERDLAEQDKFERGNRIDTLTEQVGALREALNSMAGRVEYASNMFHNSRQWHEEDAPGGSGTLWDWVLAPALASTSKGAGA